MQQKVTFATKPKPPCNLPHYFVYLHCYTLVLSKPKGRLLYQFWLLFLGFWEMPHHAETSSILHCALSWEYSCCVKWRNTFWHDPYVTAFAHISFRHFIRLLWVTCRTQHSKMWSAACTLVWRTGLLFVDVNKIPFLTKRGKSELTDRRTDMQDD